MSRLKPDTSTQIVAINCRAMRGNSITPYHITKKTKKTKKKKPYQDRRGLMGIIHLIGSHNQIIDYISTFDFLNESASN
jgi:hypothetical protein